MKQRIIDCIQKEGPLRVSQYMQMCLYDLQDGYYVTQDPFGAQGDFTTAPELTPLFGEMLGLWVAATWQQMGAPEAFALTELGPGRGTLAADILTAIKKAAPDCLNACQLHLVEISPCLQEKQQQTLSDAPCAVSWHKNVADIPADMPIIAIGNEILDAMPTNQYEKLENGKVYERLVTTDGKTLHFTHSETEAKDINAATKFTEHSPAMLGFLDEIKAKLKNGVLLLLDYGTNQIPDNAQNSPVSGDTLQAVRQHQYEDIFAAPGKADITWHINFPAVCAKLGSENCQLTDMGLFLAEIGLPVRAEQAHRAAQGSAQKEHIEQSVRRLIDPNQMGAHFKVLGWQPQKKINLAGFAHIGNAGFETKEQ